MPAESKTLTSCGSLTSGSVSYQGATGVAAGYIGDITTGSDNGFGDLTTTTTIPNYTITSTPYIANQGWISGTTSVSTIASYPKDGTLRMDPDTTEFSIYLAEYNQWTPCEVEEIRKEKDEDGNVKNIITVSFGCSVAQMKKKQRERIVMFEKVKKYDLNFWSSSVTSFIGFHTHTGTNLITSINPTTTYINGTDLINVGSINTTGSGNFSQLSRVSAGQIYYNTNNHTTSMVIDNIGTSIQI